MTGTMRDLIQDWDGLAVVVRHDELSESWFFVALHDASMGPPTGGCRMTVYERPEDGLLDAMRLARGMTFKWAGIGLEMGGGKSVIALSRPLTEEERTGVLRRFAGLLNALRGAYWAGEDLGTTPEDMAALARWSRYVHGIRAGEGEAVDPGPYTAQGVLAGMRGAARHLLGEASLAGRSVLIQGVGDVGRPLADLLAEAGAELLLSDVDQGRVREAAEETGATVVAPEEVYGRECDIFAPCAVGAVLNAETIPRLRCRIVAGSANNQLRDEGADAELLQERGILYAPDYIVNAGGAIALAYMARRRSGEEIEARIGRIEATVLEILEEAAERDESPLTAAQRRVERVLAERSEG